MPEGQEEGSRSGAFVDTDLLIRGGAVPGRRRACATGTPRRRRSQTHYQKIEESWEPAVDGFKEAVALFRRRGHPLGRLAALPLPAVRAGHRRGPRASPWTNAGWAGRWRPACGATTCGEVDTKLQKDAALAEKGDVEGLIEHVKARAKRTESVVPEDEDLLRNIVSEGGGARWRC